MKISSLQFAIFYRSYFLDYKKYASEVCDLFLDNNPVIKDINNIDSAPCDYILYAFEDNNEHRISITKQRTDLIYTNDSTTHSYNDQVNIFVQKINQYVEKFITSTNLCSRIGFVNNSHLYLEDPNSHIIDNFYTNNFNKNATDINMSFNIREFFKDTEINKVFNIVAINNTHIDDNNQPKMISISYDINTRGLKENLTQKFIFDFIDNYKNEFAKDKMELMTYGKF